MQCDNLHEIEMVMENTRLVKCNRCGSERKGCYRMYFKDSKKEILCLCNFCFNKVMNNVKLAEDIRNVL